MTSTTIDVLAGEIEKSGDIQSHETDMHEDFFDEEEEF